MRAKFDVRLYRRWPEVPGAWAERVRAGAATPFHTPAFLSAFYESFAGAEAVIVEARGADGTPALLLPLVRDPRGRIGFIDEGIVDNGAPILGPAAPTDAGGARALWRAIRAALPPADLVHLTRMPALIGGRPNPLALLPGVRPSRLSAHVLALPEAFAEYDARRSKHFRKEQRRAARLFAAFPDARFEIAESPEARGDTFAALEALQRARMHASGADYRLDRPDIAGFYARLVEQGGADGSAILTALHAGGAIVAALLALSDGASVTIVRFAHAGEPWSRASPGRLIMEKTIAALHARGVRRIDLSIGDHGYKDEFAATAEPLRELAEPLRLKGWPIALTTRARARLAASPRLRALAARLRGRSVPSEKRRGQSPG